jgi:hypothetical protein
VSVRSIENPQAISLSMFEDAEGYWAKRWVCVVRVRIEFNDGRDTLYLTPQEYTALPSAVRAYICAAPSSPPSPYEPPHPEFHTP